MKPATSSLRRFGTIKPSGKGITLALEHDAVRESRTLFPTSVVHPCLTPRILKSGHHSRKIGKAVQKGELRGAPIFTLALEERATCPSSCAMWLACYGNNMPFAQRLMEGRDMEHALWGELQALQSRYPAGFLVRVHVLGDFYSLGYVQMWSRALNAFPALHVFGYTAHDPDSDIGTELLGMALDRWDRFAVRFSGSDMADRSAMVVDHGAEPPAGVVMCPAQTGATDCCATCGFCWHSDQPVGFWRH